MDRLISLCAGAALLISIIQCSPGGSGGAEALALLGLQPNAPLSPATPPEGAGVDPAEDTVTDPLLQAIFEDLALDSETPITIRCAEIDHSRFDAWDADSYSACASPGENGWDLTVTPVYRPADPNRDPEVACKTKPASAFVEQSGGALAEYARQTCYIGYFPPAGLQGAAAPTATSIESERNGRIGAALSFTIHGGYTGATVHPESRFVLLRFDRNVCSINTNQLQESFQLWKRSSTEQWQRVPAVVQCHANAVAVYPGDRLDAPAAYPISNQLLNDRGRREQDYALESPELNQIHFDSNSQYRVLFPTDLKQALWIGGQFGEPIGKLNELGEITSEPERWNGVDFYTGDTPCFESYFDRYGAMAREAAGCGYIARDSSGAIREKGCFTFSGPGRSGRNYSAVRDCNTSLLAQTNDAWVYEFKDGSCDTNRYYRRHELPTADDDADYAEDGYAYADAMCISSAGSAQETVRFFFGQSAANAPSACGGELRRSLRALAADPEVTSIPWLPLIYSQAAAPVGHYDSLRRMKCANRAPQPTQQCEGSSPTVDILTEGGRWYTTPIASPLDPAGAALAAGGIHTFWDGEKLQLRVRVCRSGYYTLFLAAQNVYGPLPPFYRYFFLNLYSHTTGRQHGAVVEARDDVTSVGGAIVYLEEGENLLDAIWTNDAYSANEYDANLQLQRAWIDPSGGAPGLKFAEHWPGASFCEMSGRFYSDPESPNAVFPASPGARVRYCDADGDLSPGRHRISIYARLRSKGNDLRPAQVEVRANGRSIGVLSISADDNGYRPQTIDYLLTENKVAIDLIWIDREGADPSSAPEYVRISSVRLADGDQIR